MADLFRRLSAETDWEWADRRRTTFKTPKAGALAGVGTFVVGMGVRGLFGDPNWLAASFYAGAAAVIVALMAPKIETGIIWLRRHRIRYEELKESHQALQPVPAVPAPVAPPAPKNPRVTVTFSCDRTGWARIYVTNEGPGAVFSAMMQNYGLTAGYVEGRLVAVQWEEVDTPQQRITPKERR